MKKVEQLVKYSRIFHFTTNIVPSFSVFHTSYNSSAQQPVLDLLFRNQYPLLMGNIFKEKYKRKQILF